MGKPRLLREARAFHQKGFGVYLGLDCRDARHICEPAVAAAAGAAFAAADDLARGTATRKKSPHTGLMLSHE